MTIAESKTATPIRVLSQSEIGSSDILQRFITARPNKSMLSNQVERDFLLWRREGEPEVLRSVFDATSSKLLLLALHVTRDTETAGELMQTSFLRHGTFRHLRSR